MGLADGLAVADRGGAIRVCLIANILREEFIARHTSQRRQYPFIANAAIHHLLLNHSLYWRKACRFGVIHWMSVVSDNLLITIYPMLHAPSSSGYPQNSTDRHPDGRYKGLGFLRRDDEGSSILWHRENVD
jgi:hypothetical protein